LGLFYPSANRLHLFTIQKIPERRASISRRVSFENSPGGSRSSSQTAVLQHVRSCIIESNY